VQIEPQRIPNMESQNFGKEANEAEEKFKKDSAVYLQHLISGRENKTKCLGKTGFNFSKN
jgi:hypothetical protein